MGRNITVLGAYKLLKKPGDMMAQAGTDVGKFAATKYQTGQNNKKIGLMNMQRMGRNMNREDSQMEYNDMRRKLKKGKYQEVENYTREIIKRKQ